ncbi:MAG: GrpB family protein [Clostridium sp.]|nr:GrpB family protein [Clostridium sp.]
MEKQLSEMTLEELWELFPIFLTEHKEEWAEQYETAATKLKEILSPYRIVRISHIGSTSIKNIWAKPIVDILVEIASDEDMDAVANVIANNGYIKMWESEKQISFNAGYTNKGFADEVFHLHLRFQGDNNELYFRDYLNEHSDVAKDYENMKLKLWHQYEYDRDGYTNAKSDFIIKYTMKAKEVYKNKYGEIKF